MDEAALLEVLELAAENARRDRLPERSKKQRLADLAVALRPFDEHPEDAQLVLASGELIERDQRTELPRFLLQILES